MKNFNYEDGVSYYLKRISQIPLLTPEEEKELTKKVKEGDEEALKKLVQSNLRFVVNVAKKYAGYGIPFQELISAGNVGLLEAAKRFDPDKGVRFISYAIWWIRQSILQTIYNQKELIKIPHKASVLSSRIDFSYSKLKEKYNREPTYQEIKEDLKKQKIEIDENGIEKFLLVKRFSISLDTPMDVDESLYLIDMFSNNGTKDIEENLIKESLEKEIDKLLSYLSPREKLIIIHRFGLKGNEPKTLKKVGLMLGISRERVRQIERKAIQKIKSVITVKNLKDFLS